MTPIDLGYDYEKLLTNLRGFYQGSNYLGALIMLDHARSYHSGTRKNGHPEFSHQVMQAMMLRTLQSDLRFPEAVHIVVLGHDLAEDHFVSVGESMSRIQAGINSTDQAQLYDLLVTIGVSLDRMNKVILKTTHGRVHKMDSEFYYERIATDEFASVAKALDRNHNLSSMFGTFSSEKMRAYVEETRKYVLPMIKTARKTFPAQNNIYHNLSMQIREKLQMADLILDK